MHASLEEIYNGALKNLTVLRNVVCHQCHGTGSKDGINHKCPLC